MSEKPERMKVNSNHMGPTGHKMPFEFYKEMDDAGIPWSYKITDNAPDIRVMELSRNSVVPNYIIFRRSVGKQGSIGVYDVPDYNKTAKDASAEHFQLHYNELPPEVIDYRDVVIIEDINEPNKDDDVQVEWLAEFSIYEMQRWDEVGFRYACFGWAGGTPEPHHWEGPIMLELLRICASNKGQVFIAVHEYSLSSNIWNGAFPDTNEYWYVGRFLWIHEACDKHGIDYPDILITEWGYGKDTHLLPKHDIRMVDYVSVSELYAKYPNVKCATTWCYNGASEWGGLGEILYSEDLEPLKQAILTTEYPAIDDGGNMPECNIQKVRSTSIWIPPFKELTDEQTEKVVEWAEKGFTDNNGDRTSGEHMLCPSHLDAIRIHEAGLANSVLAVAFPDQIGTGVTDQWFNDNFPCVFDDGKQVVYLPHDNVEPEPEHINVVNLNQRDIRWGSKLCGFGPKTIANWGCLLTVYTMLNDHFLDGDTPKNVEDENNYYKSKGGFAGDNLVSMAMSRVYTDVKDERWLTRGANMTAKTKDYLDRGIPVTARVDFHPETSQWDQHWILLVGYDEKGWIANDPWTGLKGIYVSDYYNISGDDILECIYFYYKETTPPPPTTSDTRYGLHYRADPSAVSSAEYNEQAILMSSGGNTVKALHSHPNSVFQNIGATHPEKVVVRIMQSGWDRNITPQNFFDWNIDDLTDKVNILAGHGISPIIEVHNEQNLVQEGLTTSWADGHQFGLWTISVIALFKQRLPELKYMYAGLSPGGTIGNVRQDSTQFLQQSINSGVLNHVDYVACHAYWSSSYPMSSAIAHVNLTKSMTGKPVYVTEASINDRPSVFSPQEYGKQYKQFVNALNVEGVHFFCGSASNPYFEPETFVTEDGFSKGIATAFANS